MERCSRTTGAPGTTAARAAAAATLAVLVASCVSVKAKPAAQATEPGVAASVSVRVFETVSARNSGTPTVRTIVSELWHRQDGDWVLVRDAREPAWTATDLEPGRYRVLVERQVDDAGAVTSLGSSDRETFAVGEGEHVDVSVVLKHPGRVVGAVVVPAFLVGGLYLAARNWSPIGHFTLGTLATR